jgi:predicted ATPase
MQSAVARHDALIKEEAEKRGGHVFRQAGDAFCVAFASVREALETAISVQQALGGIREFTDFGGINVRIAIHVGEAEARNEDYFGKPLNRVARLLSVAHGGQVLISASAAAVASNCLPDMASLRDLGRHQLRDIPGEEHIFQVIVPGLRTSFPPLRTSGHEVHNFPRQLTPFIGREAAITRICDLVSTHRLVTLTGAGGIGKTRTALQAGRVLAEKFQDGVWFIELATLDRDDLLFDVICSALHVPSSGSRSSMETVVAFLQDQRSLLILDNCEHVIGAAASAIETMLEECPDVSVLTTSREAFGLIGEYVVQLSSLEFPTEPDMVSAEIALTYSAVQLFVEHAAAATGGFTLDDSNASSVCEICQRVEGIPLAVEIAAAQLRFMRPDQLAGELRDCFRVLSSVRHRGILRHQTLECLLDWSYDLLSEDEKSLLGSVSVLPGGWTADAASHISHNRLSSEQARHLTAALVQKSLALSNRAYKQPRFRLLEVTREYASSKVSGDDRNRSHERLAGYLIAFLSEAERSWPTTPTDAWLEIYGGEIDNLRSALNWAFRSEETIDLGLELVSYSLRIWDELSLLKERRSWFSTAVERLQPTTPRDTEARIWLGRTSTSAHGDRSGFEPAKLAADSFGAMGDRLREGEAFARAGGSLLLPASADEAKFYLSRALDLLEPLGHTKQLSNCLRSIGVLRFFQGDIDGARPIMQKSMSIASAVGDVRGICSAEINLAELEFAAGEVEASISRMEAVLEKGIGSKRQSALILSNLAGYYIKASRVDDAMRTLKSCLRESRALGDSAAIVRCIEHAAAIAAFRGDLDAAGRLIGFGSSFYLRGTASRELTEQESYERVLEQLHEARRQGVVQQLLDEGAIWTEKQAVSVAMALL